MRFIILCLSFLLTSCTAIETKLVSQVEAQIKVAAMPDLTQALADANTAKPPDVDGAACWQDQIDFINSWPKVAPPVSGGPGTTPKADGIASGIEELRLLEMQPSTGPVLPKVPKQLIKDCAVIVVDAQTFLNKLGLSALALKYGLKLP